MTASHFNPVAGHLLEEYTALEYILMGDLLEEPADEITCNWLISVLDALLETLPHGVELKDEGGYLSEVPERYPNWYGQVDHSPSRKPAFYQMLCELRDQIARQVRFKEIADIVRRDLWNWMTSLKTHHRHERWIVQTAFNLEVGVGD